MAYEGCEVVSLTHRPPLPPGNIPDTHFHLGLSRPQGHGTVGRNMSLKNPVTPPAIDTGTVRIVAQRLNHYATPGPNIILYNLNNNINQSKCTVLTLRLLMSYINIYIYIYGAPSKARNANVVYIYGPTFGNAETVSFCLLHNVSTLNQCREVSCVTFVCKHFAS